MGWFTRKDKKLDEAQARVAKLEIELQKAKELEYARERVTFQKNKGQALSHLKAAERYFEQMSQAKSARRSEIKAIVDNRLEKAEQLLGFKVDDITAAINRIS